MTEKRPSNWFTAAVTGMGRIGYFLLRRGPGAIRERVTREIYRPETALGRKLTPHWPALRLKLGRLRTLGRTFGEGEALLAFYELEDRPVTYDISWFVVAAELARRRQGLQAVHFVIVPGRTWESDRESREYQSIVDGSERRQRVFDILIAVMGLLPGPVGITLAGSREQATSLLDLSRGRVFPPQYSPELRHYARDLYFSKLITDAATAGEEVPSLRAPAAPLKWINRWAARICGERRLVTITLRHMDYLSRRNSDVHSWAAFAREIEARGFRAVLIPDTLRTLEARPREFEGLTVFAEAAWNVPLRAALYERAYVNLGVNTGPMSLCWLNANCRYVTFKLIVEAMDATSLDYHLSLGIDPRKPFPFAGPFQRLCVEPDTLDVIRREFDRICADIEAAEGPDADVVMVQAR